MSTPIPLGLLAAGGDVPRRVARTAAAAGRTVAVVALEGWARPEDFAGLPVIAERPGAAGTIVAFFRQHGVAEVVMTGGAQRPAFRALRPDATGARLLARVGRAYFLGDDSLLRAVAEVLEGEGFRVVSAQSVLGDVLAGAGLFAGALPDEARSDILRGIQVARALGAVDVGQSVVIQQGLVLGVEAIEGTDALLSRCAGLKREGFGGVLVKLVKPGQDRRLDLPTIGPITIRAAAAAGLAGIAVEAGGTILVDRPAMRAAAAETGLFLFGFDPATFTEETSA